MRVGVGVGVNVDDTNVLFFFKAAPKAVAALSPRKLTLSSKRSTPVNQKQQMKQREEENERMRE